MNIATVALLSAVLTAGGTVHAHEGHTLPDMGEAVDSTLSPAAEQLLGSRFMQELRQRALFLDDPLIEYYLNSLGTRLVTASGETLFPFHFQIIRDPQINAFAVPGGYVTVFSGLFLHTRNESELAGVLAHEIAHGTQRHIARMLAGQGRMTLPALAGFAAALLLGAASPQAAAAAAALGMAGTAQQQLNFTRDNEYEADRIGIQILTRSGIDPRGMVSFFEKLQRQEGSNPIAANEYLRTHPVTGNRVAEAYNRIEATPMPFRPASDSLDYGLARARLEVLVESQPQRLLDRLERNPHSEREIGEYQKALCLLRLNRPTQARERLQALTRMKPGNIWYAMALADAEEASGQPGAALKTLRELDRLYPDNAALISALGRLQLRNDPAAAHTLLREAYRRHPDNARLAQGWAEAAGKLGREGESHEALGTAFLLQNRLREAHHELEAAWSRNAADPVARARIDSRLKEIEEKIRQMESDKPAH
ncbi:MAG: M48 family metalloprotease [Pseudomonadota bacterium]